MISRIHFIRHGITEGIKNRWFYGWEDLPLIEEGVREISRFKELGVYPELGDADCYTSGMVRADQTLLPYMAMFLLRSSPILRK